MATQEAAKARKRRSTFHSDALHISQEWKKVLEKGDEQLAKRADQCVSNIKQADSPAAGMTVVPAPPRL